MNLTVKEISELVGGTLVGKSDVAIKSLSGLAHAGKSDLAFFSDPRYLDQLSSTKAGCVLVPQNFDQIPEMPVIRVKDPYFAFVMMLTHFQRVTALKKSGIENPCFIPGSVEMGLDCYVGAFSYIGSHVKIGNHVKIFPQTFIGDGVTIGPNTVIFPGVKVYSNCKIGAYCTLQAGAVIGSFGFGYLPNPDGTHMPIPQIGNVILENHVDIGANTTIDCATVDSTMIKAGTRIDNLVHIGHNVEIGQNTLIAAQTGISGSTKVGNQVTFAGQVGVAGHIHIADHTKAGGKSGITKSVRKKGTVLSGEFAFDHKQNLKAYTLYKMLPETMDRIKVMEEKLLNLGQG